MVKKPGGPPLTGAQLRAARGLIGMTALELANATLIEIKTIRRAEAKNNEQVGMTAANTRRVVAALENRGVQFIAANGGGPGVRLKESISVIDTRDG